MTQGIQTLTMDSFRGGVFARAIACITLFFFTFVFYANPAAAAVANEVNQDDQREAALEAAIETTPEKKLSNRLAKLRDKIVLELPQAIEQRESEQNWFESAFASIFSGGPITADELTELQTLSASIDAAYQEAISSFESEAVEFQREAMDAGNTLSPEVKQLINERHTQALNHIKSRYATTQAQLAKLIDANSASAQEQALEQLNQSLEQEQFKPTHTPATPDNLPWKAPDENVREPVDNPQDLQAALGLNPYAKYAQLAQAGDADPAMVAQAMANAANTELQAALAESVEVQLTPEIKALAASLNHSSIDIYTWVHNNIRFIPSYGSIQGAQHTLETKQGNAIDTASLLISLLRAANIPARYAYGTVEIPAEKVMNWVGGAQNPEAAQGILGMGGIPTIGMIEGGKVAKFKLEHVWVEAYVDYFPSRGTKEIVGDSWIPMDASFKQYDFTETMDVKNQVPVDLERFAVDIQSKAIVNEDEGWVKNIDPTDIESQLLQMQNQLSSYIESQKPGATVGAVLGLQNIKILPPSPLAAGLPYNRIITSETFTEVPNNLRHKFKYTLATENYGYADNPFIAIEEPTAKLAGKTIALSFKPATKADEDIIAAQLPAPESDGSIDPNKLPKTLPGYLINLTAELTISGEAVKNGAAGKMGGELYEEMGLWSPKGGWQTSVNHPAAGTYRAIGLDLQGVSAGQVARITQQIAQTKSKLESDSAIQLATLTKHNLVGDLLYGTVLNYFALNDWQDDVAARTANMLSYRLPSYGTFSTNLQTQYWFGIPRNVAFTGLSMDIDHVMQHRVSKSNNKHESKLFSQLVGSRWSAMEHLVPEQMFSTEEAQVHGMSAVKALAIASQQGQKIWTINRANLELALGKINLNSDAENDIRNAVNAGKIATAHEARLTYGGWVGEGYLLIDPNTGAGAYMISGGANGGVLELLNEVITWAGVVVDSLLVGIEKTKGKLMDAFRFLMGAASKLFNILSTVLGIGLTTFDFFENCPAEAIALALPAFLFLTGMTIFLTAFILTGVGAIIGGIIAGAMVSAFSGGVVAACRGARP